ncbi:MAG: DUF6528 family protein [Gemmatimonadota bacterium]|nr:DUF6528 family protein [Gemmatimonadota bacterium]
MNKLKIPLIAIIVLLASGLILHTWLQAGESADELILCGWDEVFILKSVGGDWRKPEKVWSWQAEDRNELPDSVKPRFGTTDECKPVDGGKEILITSSGGAVALVRRENGRVLFWGLADNAHSAELLPEGRIAVAASHKEGGRGDRLIIYDIASGGARELISAELPWGHGVVWDEDRMLLWALADRDIRVYRLKDWSSGYPFLERIGLIELPERGGHDLYPVPGTPFLSVSTLTHCWLFDRDTRRIKPHPDLADKVHVKSICVNPVTGQSAWIEAERPNWWAGKVLFCNPADTLELPGERLYKARWNAAPR